MAEPMSAASPEKLNAASNRISTEDDMDTTSWHDPPSSPFISNIENEDRENVDPVAISTPSKAPIKTEDDLLQSAFKASPEKKAGLKDRTSPRKASPVKFSEAERSTSAMSSRSRGSSPTKSSRDASTGSVQLLPAFHPEDEIDFEPTPKKRLSSPQRDHPNKRISPPRDHTLRDNEGLTVAMRLAEQTQDMINGVEMSGFDDTEFNADGPEFTSLDVDDTGFSMFSEMPGMDMTKFAAMTQTPSKNGFSEQATPRARPQMTPSTVRRSDRTPSPTPRRSRNDNDTTNLLLDFTAQIEAFTSSRRGSPPRERTSHLKSSTEPNLAAFYQNQRSPAKGGSSQIPATPSQSRHLLNLLDFELPPPPTPRSMPSVTIRELESLKSNFQSQISSLTASLSGKEAQVESLVKAVSDAEHRVGQAQESLRDERSLREHAEAQMEDWKKKGEEVQKLLQDVQAELARNDAEREQLLAQLRDADKRAEDAEARSSDLETQLIEAESKNVDVTTLINPDEDSRKIYSEVECQTAVAEKVNEVARDLHSAYKAKHEKKIKALKDNYQKKADERCKELRLQIIRLERQVEEAEKRKDDTFSKVLPSDGAATASGASRPEDQQLIESQKSEIENLKAKLAGVQSELESLRRSYDRAVQDLEAERVEKGELVAAAEQMLAMCGEKMEEMQQEDFRKSQSSGAPPKAPTPTPAPAPTKHIQPEPTMRATGFLAGGAPPTTRSEPAAGGRGHSRTNSQGKASGLRAPGTGGFGYGGSALSRSTSGSGKSRLLSNIERMGGGKE